MYCPKCGEQNPEGSNFCQKCGASLTAQPAPLPQSSPLPEVERTSGLAIASLVLGILGIFIGPLAILAIIFGAVAIAQTRKDPGLKGKGIALAGLVCGIVGLGLWVVALVWFGLIFLWLFQITSMPTVFS